MPQRLKDTKFHKDLNSFDIRLVSLCALVSLWQKVVFWNGLYNIH